MTFIDLSHKLADISNHVFGRVSPEHAYGVQMVSRSFTVRMQYKEAYKELEKSYDILKEVFGSENNQESSQVLNEMAVTKGHLKEFEEAYESKSLLTLMTLMTLITTSNLLNIVIEKAKEIEAQITSKTSQKYIEVQETETILDNLYEKFLEKNPDYQPPKYLKRKIAGTTLLLASLSYATFRYFKPTTQTQ